MPTEQVQLTIDLTASAIEVVGLSTPRQSDSAFKIEAVRFDTDYSPGSASTLPRSLYLGVAPRAIDTALITQIGQLELLNNMPQVTTVNQIIGQTSEDQAGVANLTSIMTRSGTIIPPQDMYALVPNIFIGTGSGQLVATNPTTFNVLAEVDFEMVKLTNTVATIIATQCGAN